LCKSQGIINNVLSLIGPCGERCNVDVLSSEWYAPDPTGYIANSFKAALHCILAAHSFEDAVVKAPNAPNDNGRAKSSTAVRKCAAPISASQARLPQNPAYYHIFTTDAKSGISEK
jgi:hypothetical protein